MSPFSKIIEIRLNDEKRKLIKIEDQIEFSSRKSPKEKTYVEVISLDYFKNFKELCEPTH